MNSRRNVFITLGFVLSVSFIAAAAAAWLVSRHYSRASFDLANAVCREVTGQDPGTQKTIAAALKKYTEENPDALLENNALSPPGRPEDNALSSLGYHVSDFPSFQYRRIVSFAAAGWITGLSLFLFTFLCRNRAENRRIKDLASYLEQVNSGKALIMSASGEDDFSKLEDEIYKTVTSLYHAKDQAVRAKNDFAENLSNIAHQIKTPITAISLAVQRMKQDPDRAVPVLANIDHVPEQTLRHTALEQIEKQLSRLTYLEESLLTLARLDAGTLVLQIEKTDVFTLLTLAADNLQELCLSSGSSIEIPEQEELLISADMDWTMEAFMNLMKNCIEHTPGGAVHCSYAQNPLYTEILIWDNGEGFAKEDLPHLFERFYRGQNAHEGGIGIGLALAKEIIERQNGTIRAANSPGGGALFEIRFYCH